MKAWKSLVSGTRLWRGVVVAQVVLTLLNIGVSALIAAVPGPNSGVFVTALAYTVLVSGIVFAIGLVLVGLRWRDGVAGGYAAPQASTYFGLAIVALVFEAWGTGLGLSGHGELPGGAGLIAGIIALAMPITALGMHSRLLEGIDFNTANRALSLRKGLIGIVVVGLVSMLFGPLGGLLLFGVLLASFVWLIYFLRFLSLAVQAYEEHLRPNLDAAVFD